MAADDWAQLEYWDDKSIIDENGHVSICFGLAATLYFSAGHTLEKRRAALECFNEYERMCGPFLVWHLVDGEIQRFSPVNKLKSRDMSPYLLSPKWDTEAAREHAWSFFWHGGQHGSDASPFRIYAYGSPKKYADLDGSLSFIQVSFPVLWLVDRAESFIAMILHWCEFLYPVHGYGGITLLDSPDRGVAQRAAPEIAHFAARFPGIEIDRPMSHKFELTSGIKGANWLTILDDHFLHVLGGVEKIKEELSQEFKVISYARGAIIVAGTAPEVGDRNRQIDTPKYRFLSGVLRPIRISRHRAVYPRGPLAEPEWFEAWLARFDV